MSLSRSMTALATLWAIVNLFESYRTFNYTLDLKFTLNFLSALPALYTPQSKAAVVLSYSLSIACWWLAKVPFSWDSEYWCAQTDISVVLFLLLAPSSDSLGDAIRLQMGIFYLGAGLWKLNTAFLNPTSSCASIYVAQLLDALVPTGWEPSATLATLAIRAAPAMTVLGETSIGYLLLLPSRSLRRTGILLAVTLHLGIALTPPPNNIAEYGVIALIRLAWAIPEATASALNEMRSTAMWSGIHIGAGALLLAILAARGPLGTINTGLGGWKTLLQDASPFSIMEVLTTLTDAILLETDFATNKRNLIDFVYWIYNFGPLILNALDLPGAMYGGVASLTLRALYLDAQEGDVILVSKEAEAKALKVKEEAAISKARAKARAQERVEADIQAAAQRSAIKAAEKELDAKRRTLIAQGKPITPLHRTPSQTLILDSTPSPERPPPLSTPKTPADFGGELSPSPPRTPRWRSSLPSMLVTLMTSIAVYYAFGSVILGTLDISSPNMFSNLRLHGGSNHLLFPTSLLHKWYASSSPSSDFAGGVVRIESSTSTLINSIHPAELTTRLAPKAKSYLHQAGHTGRHFNSAVAQVVGPFAVAPNPFSTGKGPFVRYTLPAHELRRLLHRARATNEPFELTYTRLDGAHGDEEWRANSGGTRVTLHEDGKGGVRCYSSTVLGSSTALLKGGVPCAKDELVLLPPPSVLEHPLNILGLGQSYNSFPVVEPVGELHCYGS